MARRLIRSISKNAHPALVLLAGAGLWLAADSARRRLHGPLLEARAGLSALVPAERLLARRLGEAAALKELKASDVAQFKAGLSKLTESKRALYEAGVLLQEDKRLLEKQWEIMTTYLLVDEPAGKVHLMRGEQALASYPVAYVPARPFGWGAPKPLPTLGRIVSKERFAHPERGQYEESDGQLVWSPPQVGSSVRANALGQFVMFGGGSLILHGPPSKTTEHEQFPHYCLGLSLDSARRLYASSTIGTKILVKSGPPGP